MHQFLLVLNACVTDVFNHFKSGTKFFCFAGQSNQAVTGMYNLYRASQVMFPGEDILAEANIFAVKFLQEKRANNELFDKWIITKDLAGEVLMIELCWCDSDATYSLVSKKVENGVVDENITGGVCTGCAMVC